MVFFQLVFLTNLMIFLENLKIFFDHLFCNNELAGCIISYGLILWLNLICIRYKSLKKLKLEGLFYPCIQAKYRYIFSLIIFNIILFLVLLRFLLY